MSELPVKTPDCSRPGCGHPADYFPRVRLKGTKDMGIILHIPLCHDCSLEVPEHNQGRLPTFFGLFQFDLDGWQRMFRDCGLTLNRAEDVEIQWMGFETREARNALHHMGSQGVCPEGSTEFITKPHFRRGCVVIISEALPTGRLYMSVGEARDMAVGVLNACVGQVDGITLVINKMPVSFPLDQARLLANNLLFCAKALEEAE